MNATTDIKQVAKAKLEDLEVKAIAKGEANVNLPMSPSPHGYHFLAVVVYDDLLTYIEVTNTHGDYYHREEKMLSRDEALAILEAL